MSRTNLNDFEEAMETIDILLNKYDVVKGRKWETQGVRDQGIHVRGHLDTIMQITRDMPMEQFEFEEFISLACRGLMLLHHAILKYPDEARKWKEDTRSMSCGIK